VHTYARAGDDARRRCTTLQQAAALRVSRTFDCRSGGAAAARVVAAVVAGVSVCTRLLEASMSVFHDEVEIEDFEWDAALGAFVYPCPCGDRFLITKVRLVPTTTTAHWGARTDAGAPAPG
jgi:hypothetical protein